MSKLMSNPHWIERFRAYGCPDGFCLLIRILEAVGAIGGLIPHTGGDAAMALFGIMMGAGVAHVTHHEAPQIGRPTAVGVLLAIVIYRRKPSFLKQGNDDRPRTGNGTIARKAACDVWNSSLSPPTTIQSGDRISCLSTWERDCDWSGVTR